MEVRATELFEMKNLYPKELDHIPVKGEVFEVTEERFNFLSGDNPFGGQFVKVKPKKKRV